MTAAEIGSQSGLSGTYRGPSLAARGRDERMRAISARHTAPVGIGGTGTPPTLILHAPGTRMSGGTGYSASKRRRVSLS